MKPFLAALILSAALGGAALAEEARLTGTVAEIFGSQMVVTAPEGRILVTLPQGATAPAPGTRVDLTGRRSGQTFAAASLEVAAAPAAPVAGMPATLDGLGLTEVVTRHERSGRHGTPETRIHGRLPDGTWLLAELRDGRLVEAAVSGRAMPQGLVDALLPPAIRGARELADLATITEIERKREGETEIEGLARDGMRVEIEFGPDGRLREVEREYDDRRSMTEEAARTELARLGYREVGFVERGSRHVEAVARNAWGDWVEVRLNDRGRIDRERAFVR